MNEVWKPIPGFVGYEASSEGRIRKVTYGILKPQTSGRQTDYPRVPIWNKRLGGPHGRRFSVHMLVARAFLGECPEGMEHNHKDGNKNNARPDNLEFVTSSQNRRHAIDVLGHKTPRGAKHGSAKLNDDKVKAVHAMRESGASLKDVAAAFGVGLATVSTICSGGSWQHLELRDLGDHRLKTTVQLKK